MAKQSKLPVSKRALLQRVARELAKTNRKAVKARGANLWHIVSDGVQVGPECTLLNLATMTGALREFERLA